MIVLLVALFAEIEFLSERRIQKNRVGVSTHVGNN